MVCFQPSLWGPFVVDNSQQLLQHLQDRDGCCVLDSISKAAYAGDAYEQFVRRHRNTEQTPSNDVLNL